MYSVILYSLFLLYVLVLSVLVLQKLLYTIDIRISAANSAHNPQARHFLPLSFAFQSQLN